MRYGRLNSIAYIKFLKSSSTTPLPFRVNMCTYRQLCPLRMAGWGSSISQTDTPLSRPIQLNLSSFQGTTKYQRKRGTGLNKLLEDTICKNTRLLDFSKLRNRLRNLQATNHEKLRNFQARNLIKFLIKKTACSPRYFSSRKVLGSYRSQRDLGSNDVMARDRDVAAGRRCWQRSTPAHIPHTALRAKLLYICSSSQLKQQSELGQFALLFHALFTSPPSVSFQIRVINYQQVPRLLLSIKFLNIYSLY